MCNVYLLHVTKIYNTGIQKNEKKIQDLQFEHS